MWALYLLFVLLLLIYCVIIVVAYGLRCTIRLDINNLSICIKVYIFDWIEVLSVKFFVCGDKFYYQINKSKLKILKNSDKKQNKKNKNKKFRAGAYLFDLVSNMPDVKLRQLSLQYGVEFDEIKDRAIFDGAVYAVVNAFLALKNEKLAVSNLSLENISDSTNFRGVLIEINFGLTAFKMIFYSIRAFLIKRRYMLKA